MKCDVIAEGIVEAAKSMDIRIPVVVRLDGTNAKKGREILRESGLSLIPARTFGEAARTAVELTRGIKED